MSTTTNDPIEAIRARQKAWRDVFISAGSTGQDHCERRAWEATSDIDVLLAALAAANNITIPDLAAEIAAANQRIIAANERIAELTSQCSVENCTGRASHINFIMAGIKIPVCERHHVMYKSFWRASRDVKDDSLLNRPSEAE